MSGMDAQVGLKLMTDFPNRIIHILQGCPNGLTSKDIAERLGTTRRNVSSRLSKLAAYGIIGRGSNPICPARQSGLTVVTRSGGWSRCIHGRRTSLRTPTEFEYRIKSASEEHEPVARESELTRASARALLLSF